MVLVVSVISVLLVISVVMTPKGKSKPPAKLPAKRKLESDKDRDVEEVTPAKRKRSFITAPEPPEPARPAFFLCLPAFFLCLPALPAYLH